MRQALLINIWQLSAFCLLTSSPLKLCQVGWGQIHIFRFLQKYLIGFKLRLWLGHSKTFTELCISYSCCVLIRSLSCWKVYLLPVWGSKCSTGFSWRLSQYFGALSFLIGWVPQSLPLKNSPTAWGCYQHTLLLGWYSAGDEQSLVPFKHDA